MDMCEEQIEKQEKVRFRERKKNLDAGQMISSRFLVFFFVVCVM